MKTMCEKKMVDVFLCHENVYVYIYGHLTTPLNETFLKSKAGTVREVGTPIALIDKPDTFREREQEYWEEEMGELRRNTQEKD